VPFSRVLKFSDPLPCQAAVQGSDVEIFPTTRGDFVTEITQIRMNRLWMQRFYASLPQVITLASKPDRRSISFLTQSGSSLQHCGMEVSPGAIIVNGFNVVHQRSEANIHRGAMSLPADEFDAAIEALVGRDFPEKVRDLIIQPNPILLSRLLKLHNAVGQLAHDTPDILELPEVCRALEQQLIHVMVRCLAEGAAVESSTGGRRHDAIVARFEGLLEANPDRPLYLPEICAAIGVAERTLRACCEEHLGMGPIRYLTLRRMHLVRRALLYAEPSKATVTHIVTDHGFWELGRFSVAYRMLFGESPSETLRRPAENLPKVLSRPSSLETGRYLN
jgi:AraC-like DNA-binding protein